MSVMFSREAARQFNGVVQSESRAWDSGLTLSDKPGVRDEYVEAGHQFVRLIRPQLPPEIGQHGDALEAAFVVSSCFAFTVARIAVRDQLDQATLYRQARARTSYHTILTPAQTTRKLANAIEHTVGLRPSACRPEAEKLAEYKSSGEGFGLADAEWTADHAAYSWGLNDKPILDGMPRGNCPAPELGMVSVVHQAMVEIANRDPRLFAATLAHRV